VCSCSCATGLGRWLGLFVLLIAVPACGSQTAGPTAPDISTLSMFLTPAPLSAQRQADGTWSVPWQIVIQDAARVGFRVQSWNEELRTPAGTSLIQRHTEMSQGTPDAHTSNYELPSQSNVILDLPWMPNGPSGDTLNVSVKVNDAWGNPRELTATATVQ
jgi:hypothetical protein